MPITEKLCGQCTRDTLKPASCMDINISINRPKGKSGDWNTFARGCYSVLQIAVCATPRMADSVACFVRSFINRVKCTKMYIMNLLSREKSVFSSKICFPSSLLFL